jgi:hypothetical protein
VDIAAARAFLKRWNRTINYWNNGILQLSDLPIDATEEDRDFIEYIPYLNRFEQLKVN